MIDFYYYEQQEISPPSSLHKMGKVCVSSCPHLGVESWKNELSNFDDSDHSRPAQPNIHYQKKVTEDVTDP